MAKEKKQSAYTREREKFLRKVRQLQKQGYELSIPKPLTEKQLKQQGISGRNLAKQTNQLKKQNKQFSSVEFFQPDSGEIYTPDEIKRLNRQMKELEKENERRFWSGEEQLPIDTVYPDGGVIAYDNFVDDFISKLQNADERDLSGASDWAKKKYARKPDAKMASQNAVSFLMDVIKDEVEIRGKSSVGWSIAQNVEENDIDLTLYGYSEALVNNAVMKIASAIRQRPVTQAEQANLSEQMSESEEYTDYDNFDEY